MPTLLQCVAQLVSLSGFPLDDNVQNVLHVLSPGDDTSGASLTSLGDAIGNFFDSVAAGNTEAVGEYISTAMSRNPNACTVTMYGIDFTSPLPPFGSPLATTTFTLPAANGTTSYPSEVASVISYNADLTGVPVSQANPTPPPLTIRPQQRRRGRMYVGPLDTSSGGNVGNQVRPTSGFRTVLANAFDAMANAINGISDYELVVFSRADEFAYPVVAGYIDDAFDIQRRRGVDPTTRTTFTV